MRNIVGHSDDIATDELRVLLHVRICDIQRVLDHLPRRSGKQPVQPAIDGHVRHDGYQYRRYYRDDREQADDLDVQPGSRPAATTCLDNLPDLPDDDGHQQQDRCRVDQKEGNNDRAGRRDRRQAGQDDKGQEGRKQRQANRDRRQQATERPTALLGSGRIKRRGRRICAGHRGNG